LYGARVDPAPVDPLAALRRDPASTGIFTDFDGTLSPIVADPASAAPVPGVPELLEELARSHAVVAVISGRPVSFLGRHLPDPVVAVGLYGLEVRRDGRVEVDPTAEGWRPAVSDAVERARSGAPSGVVVEAKDLSLTLHYRTAPEAEGAVVALAEEVARATGLEARPAKMSVELHPPVHADKGTALHSLARGLRAVCYLGDDRGDMAAFAALDDLAAEGINTVKVAVRGAEAPAALVDAADVVVDGPEAAADVLRELLPHDPA
jgi:trehalose 6-phosphate phosphatase